MTRYPSPTPRAMTLYSIAPNLALPAALVFVIAAGVEEVEVELLVLVVERVDEGSVVCAATEPVVTVVLDPLLPLADLVELDPAELEVEVPSPLEETVEEDSGAELELELELPEEDVPEQSDVPVMLCQSPVKSPYA